MSAAPSLRRAVYPGSFNPPTVSHLAIVDAVRSQRDVGEVVLSVSSRALAKEHVERPLFEHRIAVLEQMAAATSGLRIAVTDAQLLSDIASDFDVLVMGADKWHQINEVQWYDNSPTRRDAAIASLPELAIAPRPPLEVPAEHLLHLDRQHAHVSSSRARAGDLELMTPSAQLFALETGAWIDPDRYERWLGTRPVRLG